MHGNCVRGGGAQSAGGVIARRAPQGGNQYTIERDVIDRNACVVAGGQPGHAEAALADLGRTQAARCRRRLGVAHRRQGRREHHQLSRRGREIAGRIARLDLVAVRRIRAHRHVEIHQGVRAHAAQEPAIAIHLVGRHAAIIARAAPAQQHAGGGQARIRRRIGRAGRLGVRCAHGAARAGAGAQVRAAGPLRRLAPATAAAG